MWILIESGSSKSDWIVLENKNIQNEYKTIGFNPRFHTVEFIVSEIQKQPSIIEISNHVNEIYFYGAGCSNPEMNQIIKLALSAVFKLANRIEVHSDLLACARSSYHNKPIISCILGTGSNSCYFDGNEMFQQTPSLGYILGDEGSGASIGKQFLVDFLYNKIPSEIRTELLNRFPNLNKDFLIHRIYKEPYANVFLASFSEFLNEFKTYSYVTNLIESAFESFIKNHVLVYEKCKEVAISFVGSVAFYYQDILNDVLIKHGLVKGEITKKPIDGLVQYHLHHSL